MLGAVDAFDRRLGFRVAAHLDESKALAAAGVAIVDHFGALHRPKLSRTVGPRSELVTLKLRLPQYNFFPTVRSPVHGRSTARPITFGAEAKAAGMAAYQEGRLTVHQEPDGEHRRR